MSENTIPIELDESLAEYAEALIALNEDQAIVDLKFKIDQLKEKLDKLSASHALKIKEFEQIVKARVMLHEESVSAHGVKCTFTSGYTRVTWNKDEMASILFDNPALIPMFKPAKKEKPVSPRVLIKYVGVPEEERVADKAPF